MKKGQEGKHELFVSEDAITAYDRYTKRIVAVTTQGAMEPHEREQLRSDAVDFMGAIMRSNPDVFHEYRDGMLKALRSKRADGFR